MSSKKKKFILCGGILIVVLLFFLGIGFFYGESNEELLGPTAPDPFFKDTLYKYKNNVYYPVAIENGHVVNEIPKYFGEFSDSILESNFTTNLTVGDMLGKTDADLFASDISVKHDVYKTSDDLDLLSDDFIFIKIDNDQYVLCAKVTNYYSKHTNGDWYAYSKELDNMHTLEAYASGGRSYYLCYSRIENSAFYTEKNMIDRFLMRWNFFIYDIKNFH